MSQSKKHTASLQTQEEASQTAKSIQRPGQTKEQTKAIAQGIQKGIELYKKQHKAKLRELDKRQKKSKQMTSAPVDSEQHSLVEYRQNRLPWVILVVSWLGFASYLIWLG
jgi:hypothetical protein